MTMSSSKLLKERIESIQDTMKITNAMYLISSSKLRKARQNYQNVSPYFNRMRDTISRVVPHLPEEPVHPFFHGQDNPRAYHLGRWTEENPNSNAIYPRIYTASSPHTTYNRAFNEYHIFDADYFRIKTISFGYNVPKSVITRLGLSSLTGENLFTIRADHKMKDFDPEATSSTIQALGTKSLAFGVNVSF
jgi:hypothetical protein